jgi:hypothetical protein
MIDKTVLKVTALLNEGSDGRVGRREGEDATSKIPERKVFRQVNKVE